MNELYTFSVFRNVSSCT